MHGRDVRPAHRQDCLLPNRPGDGVSLPGHRRALRAEVAGSGFEMALRTAGGFLQLVLDTRPGGRSGRVER